MCMQFYVEQVNVCVCMLVRNMDFVTKQVHTTSNPLQYC